MSANIPQIVRELIAEYRRFLRTSYRFLDDGLRTQFNSYLEQADVVVRGPYVTLARDFAVGDTLRTLVERSHLPTSRCALGVWRRSAVSSPTARAGGGPLKRRLQNAGSVRLQPDP